MFNGYTFLGESINYILEIINNIFLYKISYQNITTESFCSILVFRSEQDECEMVFNLVS